MYCSRSAKDKSSARKGYNGYRQDQSPDPETEVGEVSSSYCEIFVSHLVEDESGRGGNETGNNNIETARSGKGTDKVVVCNGD
jgi:hypothetical protein